MGRPFFRKYTSTSAYRNAVSSVTFKTRTDGLLRNCVNCAVFSTRRFPARNPLYNSPRTTAETATVSDRRITWRQEVGASSIEALKIAGHSTVRMTEEYTKIQLTRQEELTTRIQERLCQRRRDAD